MTQLTAISLFSSGGIGDLALDQAKINVLVANEYIYERAEVFKYNFPEVCMIQGDIWLKQAEIINQTQAKLKGKKLDFVLATPPCQGMSKNGRGKLLNSIKKGNKSQYDERNRLIIPTLNIVKALNAETLVMENVPEMLNTQIPLENNQEVILILDYIQKVLGNEYKGTWQVVEFANYGIPQKRQRLITIFTKNQTLKNFLYTYKTLLPNYTHSLEGKQGLQKWVTVRDVISHLPALDANSKEKATYKPIPFHRVPTLDQDKYFWVSNIPPEKSAFDNQCVNPKCLYNQNPVHSSSLDVNGVNRSNTDTPIRCLKCGQLLPRPWVKVGNELRLMKGYTSAYKRMSWDLPASTLTTNLSYACSDNKIHPEQNRVLSLYEAMILHTITDFSFHWQRKDAKPVSDKIIREIIGESVPPKGMAIIFDNLVKIINQEINTTELRHLESLEKRYYQLSLF